MSGHPQKGQALLEIAIGIPLLLAILAGGYVAWRTAGLSGRAGSVAYQQALRTGRRLPDLRRELAHSVLESPGDVRVEGSHGRNTRLLPSPLPALAGRSQATATVRKTWDEVGALAHFEPLRLVRESELSADCWDRGSPSGKKTRRIVAARAALALLR